jgi:hypothetical protein
MSELMRAAAKGILSPYDPPEGGGWYRAYDNDVYERALQLAGVFNAIAAVYEAHEKQAGP